MDPSSSRPSNASLSSKAGSSSGPFAYQTRLLERTSSRGSGGSLSRSSSQSGKGILTNTTGSSSSSASPRKWAPSHRVGNSLDAVRGKWEERAQGAAGEDTASLSLGSKGEGSASRLLTTDPPHDLPAAPSDFRPTTPTKQPTYTEPPKTPTYLKRRTLPAPIIASPLSPNTTGITVESDPSASALSSLGRIHLPSSSSTSLHSPSIPGLFEHSVGASLPAEAAASPRYRRSNTLDSANWTGSSSDRLDDVRYSPPKSTSRPYGESSLYNMASPSVRRRPTSLHSSGPDTDDRRPFPSSRHAASSIDTVANPSRSPVSLPSTSVMSPTPYRSSYMSNKKSSTYGDNLTAGRKLGRHLPRIASGDVEEKFEVDAREDERFDHHEKRERRTRDWNVDAPLSPEKVLKQELVGGGVPNADDVAGLPGRLQLKAPSIAPSPSPSSRLLGGLWADTQRHLIHAYEYLCHVGEAQQWIEGCLGEELGFGVVEMEDGLRNGVVLAKLVRAFQGEDAVKRIYEVSVTKIVAMKFPALSRRPRSWTSATQTTLITSSILFVKLAFLK
jgi:Ras GTPase-activating-like protein IQGAP2/3